MDYYLTDSIFIRDNAMFHTKRNKTFKINKNNWHTILQEYGWEKLPLPWIKQLNLLSSSKNKNSRFGTFDCEHDGNCFFHCIANSLNERDRMINEEYNHTEIRNKIADSITNEQFETLMSYYIIFQDANDFDEEWDPSKVKNIDDFKRQLRETGHNYWCDYLLLPIIIQALNLNILIMNNDSDTKDYTIYNTLNDYNPKYDSVILMYEDKCHFKLVGYFDDDKMISYFTNETIPEELKQLFNLGV